MPPKQRKTRNSQPRTTPPVVETTEQIIERRVAEAIAQYEASRNRENVVNNSGATHVNSEATTNTQQGCSYKTFQSCKPSSYTGTEGAIGLVHWIEKMESVLDISDCAADKIVKYATCTLADKALTWWNAQVQVMGRPAAYSMTWETLKQMMMEEFCPPNEIERLETEFWNIQMIGADIIGYTTRFQELARLVPHMVTPERERIKKYLKGLAPQIRGMVMSSKPATFRSAVDLAQSLTDDAVLIGTLKTATGKTEPTRTEAGDNKRKWNNEGNDRQGQQNRNPGNARAYATITNTETKPYQGKRPKCGKCEKHHEGDCFFCVNCNRFGHSTQACRTHPTNNEQRNTGCFRCGEPGHYRNQCPQLNNANNNRNNNNQNNNNNNRFGNTDNARGRAYILCAPETVADLN